MPTTSVRRRISLLRRSCGLLDQIFFQWAVRLGQRGKRGAAHSLGHDTSDKRLRYGIRGLHQINGGKTSNGTARSATVCGCRLPTMGPVSLMTTQRAARASGTWGRRPSAWAAGSSWRRAGPNGERRDLRAPLRAYERRELKCLQPRSESCWWVITRLCGSLQQLLERTGEFEVVGHAGDGEEAVVVWAVRNGLPDD